MNILAVSLVLSCVAVLGYTEFCTPDQWEAGLGGIGGYSEGRDTSGPSMKYDLDRSKKGFVKLYSKVHYDFKNKRLAYRIFYENNMFEDIYNIFILFNEGKVYTVDNKKDECFIKDVKYPFNRACIPESAKKLGSYHIGPKDGLNVTSWSMKHRENSGIEAVVTAHVLDNGAIIPVSEAVWGQIRSLDFLQTFGYNEVAGGIKDPSVFDIPKKCRDQGVVTPHLSLHEEIRRVLTFLP